MGDIPQQVHDSCGLKSEISDHLFLGDGAYRRLSST
eukprot:COSAG06_NODE_70709_length_190_cov_110.549451_1_plen_35_part_10